jgi:WD40 repeat protein
LIASASADKTVTLWSRDGNLINILKAHSDKVFAVSFKPDGKWLASASKDQTVILWNLDLDNLLDRGCYRLRDYLKTNPNVSESDRTLCDDILAQK